LLSCLIAACAADTPVELNGAGKFCIPAKLLPGGKGAVPEGLDEKDVGFSFRGCGRQADRNASCVLPAEVISVDVTTLAHSPAVYWKQIRSAAAFVMLMESSDTTLRGDAGSQRTWISNPKSIDQLYMFSGASAVAFSEFPGDARLELACDHGPLEGEVAPFATACSRYLSLDTLTLKYRFEPRGNLIQQVDRLDGAVTSQLEHWRCD